MHAVVHLLLLYLKYSLTVLALGIMLVAGLWTWLSLVAVARMRLDR
jgi:hypothetical protein